MTKQQRLARERFDNKMRVRQTIDWLAGNHDCALQIVTELVEAGVVPRTLFLAPETWREVPGFPAYEVSSVGSVRRKVGDDKYRPVTLTRHSGGYLMVSLNSNRGSSSMFAHRLVLLAFRGPPPRNTEACHLNGKKDDNRVDNLVWDTHTANVRQRKWVSDAGRGERHGNAKLTNEIVQEIVAAREMGATVKTLAAKYGVHHSTISRVCTAQTWTHLPDEDGI